MWHLWHCAEVHCSDVRPVDCNTLSAWRECVARVTWRNDVRPVGQPRESVISCAVSCGRGARGSAQRDRRPAPARCRADRPRDAKRLSTLRCCCEAHCSHVRPVDCDTLNAWRECIARVTWRKGVRPVGQPRESVISCAVSCRRGARGSAQRNRRPAPARCRADRPCDAMRLRRRGRRACLPADQPSATPKQGQSCKHPRKQEPNAGARTSILSTRERPRLMFVSFPSHLLPHSWPEDHSRGLTTLEKLLGRLD